MTTLPHKVYSLFDRRSIDIMPSVALRQPATYTGLANFHKYWGKKPTELLSYLIQNLTEPGDIVLDSFLGGGLVVRSTLEHHRRFIGIDVNPVSIELAKLFISLPKYSVYKKAVEKVSDLVRRDIDNSYQTENGTIATHLLWDEREIQQVWSTIDGKRRIHSPTPFDVKQSDRFSDYSLKYLRNITCFDNSRINSYNGMNWFDLFTPRAVHNIELLCKVFDDFPEDIRRALQLTLTSNMGQMSKMVFAISNRGKSKVKRNTNQVEVGSWAIGFWRPQVHFEINVWNCFYHRAIRLLKALKETEPIFGTYTSDVTHFFRDNKDCAMILDSCLRVLPQIRDDSVSLIVVDPPHGSRMPYLELSEFWNAVLSYDMPDFDSEIIVSNAKNRQKDSRQYQRDMRQFIGETSRILHPKRGVLALMFNSSDTSDWQFLREETGLVYHGCFPQKYSANSLVQDNRAGALKEDYILFFSKNASLCKQFESLCGWSQTFPAQVKGKTA